MGRFDGFYEFNLHPWDIAAGALIAHEAGALVTDWNGEKMPHDGSRILCANKSIHREMIDVLNQKKYFDTVTGENSDYLNWCTRI